MEPMVIRRLPTHPSTLVAPQAEVGYLPVEFFFHSCCDAPVREQIIPRGLEPVLQRSAGCHEVVGLALTVTTASQLLDFLSHFVNGILTLLTHAQLCFLCLTLLKPCPVLSQFYCRITQPGRREG